jgi:hypothetical protein
MGNFYENEFRVHALACRGKYNLKVELRTNLPFSSAVVNLNKVMAHFFYENEFRVHALAC